MRLSQRCRLKAMVVLRHLQCHDACRTAIARCRIVIVHRCKLFCLKSNDTEHIVIENPAVYALNHKGFIARGLCRCQQGGIGHRHFCITLGNGSTAIVKIPVVLVYDRQDGTIHSPLNIVSSLAPALFQSPHYRFERIGRHYHLLGSHAQGRLHQLAVVAVAPCLVCYLS